MSWFQKSEDSFRATNKLIKDSLYNTSVHCSYYSCIQLILHIVHDKLKIPAEEVELNTNNEGSHNWLVKIITTELKTITSRREAREFNDKIQELKRQRVIADYKLDLILQLKAEEVRQNSYQIRDILIKTF